MSKSIDTLFWSILGGKGPLLFGEECGSAAVWMILALAQRCILLLLRIERYVPSGLIFAFPMLIQCFGKYIPFLRENYPVLPVRLAEGIMGRISPAKMLIIIPAHFLGSVVGIVAFKVLLPFIPAMVFHPVVYNTATNSYGLLVEAFAVFCYVLIVLVLPELIEVNKLNPKFLSISMLPIMFLRHNGNWCTINPSVIYALWYVNRVYSNANGAYSLYSLYDLPSVLQLLHIVAPFLGAVAAGLFCNYLFADSPTSWRRRSERFK